MYLVICIIMYKNENTNIIPKVINMNRFYSSHNILTLTKAKYEMDLLAWGEVFLLLFTPLQCRTVDIGIMSIISSSHAENLNLPNTKALQSFSSVAANDEGCQL